MLDQNGRPIGTCDDPFSSLSSSHVREVLVLVGGPSGISESVGTSMMQVVTDECYGLHRTAHISIPSGKGGPLHSYIALAAVFLEHDKGRLLPSAFEKSPGHAQNDDLKDH